MFSVTSAKVIRFRSKPSTRAASVSVLRWSVSPRVPLNVRCRYTKEREQFGQAINSFQAVQFQLAEMAVEIEAARLLVYNAARRKDAGQPFLKEAAIGKLYSSRVAEKVSSTAIELYGGYGYVKDYPVEKFWRDSKIGAIYEGTSNMQLQTIAKLIMSGK